MGKVNDESPQTSTGARRATGWVTASAIPGTYGEVSVTTSGTGKNGVVRAELGLSVVEVVIDPAGLLLLANALTTIANEAITKGGRAMRHPFPGGVE